MSKIKMTAKPGLAQDALQLYPYGTRGLQMDKLNNSSLVAFYTIWPLDGPRMAQSGLFYYHILHGRVLTSDDDC